MKYTSSKGKPITVSTQEQQIIVIPGEKKFSQQEIGYIYILFIF